MDPATRRLALIAAGLGGALLLVIGGSSLLGHRTGTVPVVQADPRPIRVKPENPGGMQVAGANEDILSGDTASTAGKLAPPPETPEPQALRAPSRIVPAPVPAPSPVAVAPSAPPKPIAEKPAGAPEKHPAAPVVAKATLVQLAAVHSEEAAKSEWQRLTKRFPDLARHQPAFSKTDHDGHVLWRVRAGGFADVAQATSFCEKARAKGLGCSVADF
jgi:cell division septation protein DedD